MRSFLYSLFAVGTSLVVSGCGSESSDAESLGRRTQPLTFSATSGLASMEAENFTTNTPVGAHSWSTVSAGAASSGTALRAIPDNGTANNTGYTTASPRLDFVVDFEEAGVYYVWVRGRDSGSFAGSGDSIHAGLDGQALSSADRISSFSTSFGWSRSTMDGTNATLFVPSPGEHTVNLWMREDGFVFDKLVLTTNQSFAPSGLGPAETPRVDAVCGDDVCSSSSEDCDSCAEDCGACPTCTDGVENGDETGVDCGGSCEPCPGPSNTVVWLEAEEAQLSGNPGFSTQSDAAAANGQYLSAPSGNAYDSPGSARATFQFEVADGTYALWARVITPNADDDSFWVSVDGGSFVLWNSIAPTSSWAWARVHNSNNGSSLMSYALAAGTHTVVIANREDGARIDKLYLTANGDVPSGVGDVGTCDDGERNQGEEDIDCGGPCPACPVCTDGATQPGSTSCGENDRGNLEQECVSGQWEDTATCLDPDVCSDGSTQDGTTPCGQNARGLLEQECVSGQWEDTATCLDPDECVDGTSQPGSTPCAQGGTLDEVCVQGQWEDSVICTVCQDGEMQLGPTPCGLNGRGALEQACSGGQWVDTVACIDPDVCVDGQTQVGATQCGLNGRGTLEQVCSAGHWVDSACLDPDICTDGAARPGSTACGLNGRGLLDEECVFGAWEESSVCQDPDQCVDGQTQVGATQCGLNGRGTVEQLCSLGEWSDTATCLDPDICTDGATQPGSNPCGLNGRGTLDEQCVFGQWEDAPACQDPDVCIDDQTREGTTPCGDDGTLEQICATGQWTDSSTCIESSFATSVWLEAEDGSRSGSPGFGLQTDANAAAGQYLSSPGGTAYDAPGSARVSFTFEVDDGTYALWARVITPNADDDSFWVSVDGGSFVKWNSIAASGSWAWARVHDSDAGSSFTSYTLSAGTHTITIANREDGALLDKLYFTADGDVPSGVGEEGGTCSDGVQNQGEEDIDCGGPCAPCPFCGDASCDSGEDCISCAADCGPCGACGDGTCDPDESCSSCESDCGACPVWVNQDIGAIGAPGSLSVSGDTFTVTGSGADINSTYGDPVDEFHYVYQPISGDVTVVARVLSVQETHEWAKGGVMIRESLDADSKYAFVFSRPDGGVQAQYRSQTGQTGTDSGDPVGNGAVKWVMVERNGDELTTYYSTDGLDFVLVGSPTTIDMSATVYVGLAVTSHADGDLTTVDFDEVNVLTPAVCGDAVCDASEDCGSCGVDCGACGLCGDGTCDPDESCTSCESDCGECPPTGLEARPSNASCLAPPALSTGVAVEDVWSNVTFTRPLQVLQPPGDDSRLIVVERNGFARSAPLSATGNGQVSTFLQLSNVVTNSNGGFLSMAFHPNWETNRYAYVVYTTNNLIKRLSRFQSTNGGQSLNASTEQVIWESQHDHEFNHNGGQIAFGKDGYLYLSTGDDAYLDYQRARHTAQTNNFFGKVLRLDVDGGSPYAIPPDNPFVSGGGLPEIYAYGLRNPWRFSVDRLTGEIWLADVGEDTWEEVNIIQSGEFYGWPYYEGDDCFTGQPADCATSYTSPTYRYTSGAASISGGFVYRGPTLNSLYGKYVYGDYVSGQVSVYDPATGTAQAVPGAGGGAIAGFGEDNAGELYVVRISAGRIEKLVPDSTSGPSDFPQMLADTGCFQSQNPTQVVAGVIPYEVAQPFWSDGVVKERYLALPDGTEITVDGSGDWELPPGAVTIKNFRYQGALFETRFFVRHSDGSYAGYTYEWNAQQTQATLVPPGGTHRALSGLDWAYPSRGECFACHTEAANFSLGLETRQLNVDGYYPSTDRTANQLVTLDFIGMLTGNTTALAPYPAVDDTTVSVQERAESYLHVNCSNCHRPGGPGGGPMDVRYETPFESKRLCNEPSTLGSLGVSDPVLVAPGNHMGSIAWLRMSERGVPYAMPPLASTVVDAAGAALLQEWIDGLTGCP